MDGVNLVFEHEALEKIADLAIERNTGARGLRSIMEELMMSIMYEVPSREDVEAVVITADCVDKKGEPQLRLKAPLPDAPVSE